MLDVTRMFENLPQLETKRCVLRAITLADAQDAFEFMSDDSVTKYLPWDTARTIDDAEKLLQRYVSMMESKTGIIWGIINKSNGKLMGICLLFHFSLPNFRAEIGYALGTKWWRQGFMLEVTSEVINYGFNDVGFNSIEAQIAPANIGSQGLLEKLGFVQEGYFREYYYDKNRDTFTDNAVFSLLKSTWQNALP